MTEAAKQHFPESPEDLVEGVDKLVSLPEVCFLINDLINDPLTEIEEIGQVISQDPDLTARLLRLVNSSYYGFEGKVDTISRAILMVGLKELQHMVWASSAAETFSNIAPSDANMAMFWRHSIFTAVLARIIARECAVLHPERLFVAGLLHDVGRLLILHKIPDAAKLVLIEVSEKDDGDLVEQERNVLGYDHAEIAGALFQRWGLPEGLIDSVKYHHAPQESNKYKLEASILHVANIMAHALEMGDEENLHRACEEEAWNLLNLSAARIKPVLHEAVMQFLESLELLLPGASQRV
ncbi:MAG: HDOD domain-containing protein [Gammaproteobacteria bacterium]|nr:HDOD domain-containing protein [Gammaproteobacteria bacterium]MDH5694783.1 HDOD domain-containing protein [Gammaproteobacteria bacterium]